MADDHEVNRTTQLHESFGESFTSDKVSVRSFAGVASTPTPLPTELPFSVEPPALQQVPSAEPTASDGSPGLSEPPSPSTAAVD